MTDRDWLAEQFEDNRGHLRGVAYRMLGSLSEADDAVQEVWLRLSRQQTEDVENLRGWMTTVVARICLDMLRSRKSRREETLGEAPPAASKPGHAADPEAEAILADSVGYATLVVLDRLNPGERIAFVLHDLFDISFAEIGRIAGRTPESARQLASRARRRIRGATTLPESDLSHQQSLAEKFLAALRAADATKLMEVLDPQFSVTADAAAVLDGARTEIQGVEAWARAAVQAAKGARLARLAMVDGRIGLIVAPRGRLFRVLRFTYDNDRIAGMEVIGDAQRLRTIEIGELG